MGQNAHSTCGGCNGARIGGSAGDGLGCHAADGAGLAATEGGAEGLLGLGAAESHANCSSKLFLTAAGVESADGRGTEAAALRGTLTLVISREEVLFKPVRRHALTAWAQLGEKVGNISKFLP